MGRSLLAPLSPNEENTLRRLSLGASLRGLRAANVQRLLKLELLKNENGHLVLTEAGEQRCRALSSAGDVVSASNDPFAAFSRLLH